VLLYVKLSRVIRTFSRYSMALEFYYAKQKIGLFVLIMQ